MGNPEHSTLVRFGRCVVRDKAFLSFHDVHLLLLFQPATVLISGSVQHHTNPNSTQLICSMPPARHGFRSFFILLIVPLVHEHLSVRPLLVLISALVWILGYGRLGDGVSKDERGCCIIESLPAGRGQNLGRGLLRLHCLIRYRRWPMIILAFSKNPHHAFSLFYFYLCMSERRKEIQHGSYTEKELQLSRNTIATTIKGKERHVQRRAPN